MIGVLGGVALTLVDQGSNLLLGADFARWPAPAELLAGGWFVLGDLFADCGNAVLFCLVALMLLALVRQVVRRLGLPSS